MRASSIYGRFTLQNGHSFTYVIGNHVPRYGSSFKGIQTELPQFLPNIYIDAHNGDRGRGMRFYAEKNQMIQLEGDFNEYFQVYVPKGQHILALSILTPDVMQTLISISDRYDVEIIGQTLRLITHKRPYKHADRQADLLKALTAITEELDQRLQSWTAQSSQEAMDTSLVTEDNPSVKFGRRQVRLTTVVIGSYFGLMGAILWAVTIHGLITHHYATPGDAIRSIIVCFLFFPVVALFLIIIVPRGFLNRFHR